MKSNSTCSASSQKAGEQLFGTVLRADIWYLLEVPEPWGFNAFEDCDLPATVKSHLKEGANAVQNGRILLIKQGSIRKKQGYAFFAAVNHEEGPHLYQFELDSYEDLLKLDLPGIAREGHAYRYADREIPLFLVCTNGLRDVCCARLGVPLYQEAYKLAGEAFWQTNHVGGHRFAPNLVALPHGAVYGQLQSEDISPIVQKHSQGLIHLPRYRGRSCYEQGVQAAEYFLRAELGYLELYRFKLVEVERVSNTEAIYHFQDLHNQNTYCARVAEGLSEFEVYKSCREPEPERQTQYRLLALEVFEDISRDWKT